LIIVSLALAVSGCSKKGLMDLRHSGNGPDEFMVLPTKPLDMPDRLAALPVPTPGGANRVDATPEADAVAALGGRPEALVPQGPSAADGALIAQVSRYGVPANTREVLAEADAKFRKRQSRGTRIRLFPVDRYKQAYRRDAIDPFNQTEQFRRAGAETPTSPPLRRRRR
jgi:hypothetical protein